MEKNKMQLAMLMLLVGASTTSFGLPSRSFNYKKKFCKCGNEINKRSSEICKECALKLMNRKG